MTCNCTNGRVPGNDWTQPATPCPECSGKVTDRFAKSCPRRRASWLPSNPLAVARLAVSMYGAGRLVVTDHDGIGWRFDIMAERGGEDLPVCSAEHTDSMTAAVTLLREVTHG